MQTEPTSSLLSRPSVRAWGRGRAGLAAASVGAVLLIGACGSDDGTPAPTTTTLAPGLPGEDTEGGTDSNSGVEPNTDSSPETDAGTDGSGNPNTGGGPTEGDGPAD